MFSWYYLAQILEGADKIPREVTICAAAYFIASDIHKRMTQTKIVAINAEKETQIKSLEVERLRLELELRRTEQAAN